MKLNFLWALVVAALPATVGHNSALADSFTTITVAGAALTGASGISGSTVVGVYEEGAVGNVGHGFIDNNGVFSTFDEPDSLWNPFGNGGIYLGTYVLGASNSAIVGWYNKPVGANGQETVGFTKVGGIFTDVSVPGLSSTIATSTDGDTTVGFADSHAFSEKAGVYTLIDVPGAVATEAWGISGNTIVGTYSDAGFDHHGFVDTDGTLTTLNFPGASDTYVFDVSGNTIVGAYDIGSASFYFAESNGTFVTLDVPGNVVGAGAYPIRISGSTVVGTYFDIAGVGHGFVTTIEVPEASTISIGALACASLIVRRRRRIL